MQTATLRGKILSMNKEEAEILVQQTYSVAFAVFEQFEKNSDFNEWLNEILVLVFTNMRFYLQAPGDNSSSKAVEVLKAYGISQNATNQKMLNI